MAGIFPSTLLLRGALSLSPSRSKKKRKFYDTENIKYFNTFRTSQSPRMFYEYAFFYFLVMRLFRFFLLPRSASNVWVLFVWHHGCCCCCFFSFPFSYVYCLSIWYFSSSTARLRIGVIWLQSLNSVLFNEKKSQRANTDVVERLAYDVQQQRKNAIKKREMTLLKRRIFIS